jgi:glycerophosphoryl diester phosphodiesterase
LAPSLLARPLVYAHRGGAALRPENTIVAFDHGLALGADGLELDVRLSRDGEVVVHHDAALERTTGGPGAVAEHTAAELASLDAGCRFVDASGRTPFLGQGCGVPRLREVLERYPGVPLIVELKAADPRLVTRTIDLVRAADAVGRVALGSFSGAALRLARQYEPRISTGAGREETRWALYRSWVGWPLGRTAYREFQVPERAGRTTVVTERFVKHAHRAGLAVKVWTVDTREDVERLLGWGVDAIISDRPDVAVLTVRERISSS